MTYFCDYFANLEYFDHERPLQSQGNFCAFDFFHESNLSPKTLGEVEPRSLIGCVDDIADWLLAGGSDLDENYLAEDGKELRRKQSKKRQSELTLTFTFMH